MKCKLLKNSCFCFLLLLCPVLLLAASTEGTTFPLSLEVYQDSSLGLLDLLKNRILKEPFNLVASLIFLCAIIHAFLANKILKVANRLKRQHAEKLSKANVPHPHPTNLAVETTHYLGEVEAVFGIWVIVLAVFFLVFKDWSTLTHYISSVNYTEPVFVVVIMALASSYPIIYLAESNLKFVANLFGGGIAAYWFCILTIAPLFGSFVTEPAAMTVAAMLLAKQFYEKKPSKLFAYATIGLLFVNISVGGTLTNFAAPPVLIVSNIWGWDILYMMTTFGWKAVIGILISNFLYFLIFRKQFKNMQVSKDLENKKNIPWSIKIVHLGFIVWTVFTAHYIPLFVGGFLFFLAFVTITRDYQTKINLKSPLLVGFFLAGLVIHGGLQAWWVAPILSKLSEVQLFWGSVVLTAFNDNAAVTYLSTLVPNFSDNMKYVVVAGALTGGGLTVIANAPNPAGQAILGKYFKGGVSPLGLAAGAILPTLILSAIFLLL